MSTWTLHLSAFCDESQGLQTSNYFQLLTEEDWNYERNEILSGTMWSNILSTSANIIPTNATIGQQ